MSRSSFSFCLIASLIAVSVIDNSNWDEMEGLIDARAIWNTTINLVSSVSIINLVNNYKQFVLIIWKMMFDSTLHMVVSLPTLGLYFRNWAHGNFSIMYDGSHVTAGGISEQLVQLSCLDTGVNLHLLWYMIIWSLYLMFNRNVTYAEILKRVFLAMDICVTYPMLGPQLRCMLHLHFATFAWDYFNCGGGNVILYKLRR